MGYTPPHFNVRKITGGYSIYPDGVTTDDLTIYPNPTDTHAFIKILGLGGIELDHATANQVYVRNNGTAYLKISTTGLDAVLENIIDTGNLQLKTTGTGKIKAFTKTAHADQVIDGYVSLIDSAGNNLYLATITPV